MGGPGRAAASAGPPVLTCLACPQRMSAKSKGTPSSSSPAEGPPAASKTKVKEQIKIIVEDLELVLGDLKDVAKELKEVRGGGSWGWWWRGWRRSSLSFTHSGSVFTGGHQIS